SDCGLRNGDCRKEPQQASSRKLVRNFLSAQERGQLQRFQKVEMRIGTFQFHGMITSARRDEEVIGWHAFACLAAAVRQLASALPYLVIDRQFRNALLILAKCCAFLFSTYACP